MIATQDDALIRSLQDFPDCPILTLKQAAMTLLKPSRVAKQTVDEMMQDAVDEDNEVKELKELKKKELGNEPVTKKKRKGPKAPNPLSCKRKKPLHKDPNHHESTKDESTTGKKKRQRKRNKPKLPLPVDRVLKAFSVPTRDEHQSKE